MYLCPDALIRNGSDVAINNWLSTINQFDLTINLYIIGINFTDSNGRWNGNEFGCV